MEVSRRTLLVAAGGAFPGLAGCSGLLDRGPASTGIVDSSFETNIEVDERLADDPSVAYDDGELRVTGRYTVGTDCYEPRFPEPIYREDEDELIVTVSRELAESVRDTDRCDDAEPTAYRVLVRIEGPAPAEVVVMETFGGVTRAEL